MGNMNGVTDRVPNAPIAIGAKAFIQNTQQPPMAYVDTADAMLAKINEANAIRQQQYATNAKSTTTTTEPKTGALANIWLTGISSNIGSLASLVTAVKTPREQQLAQQPLVVVSAPSASPPADSAGGGGGGGNKTAIIVGVVVLIVLGIGFFAFKQG